MARSQYIYIVRDTSIPCDYGDIVAAFTVKHEALSFVKKRGDKDLRMSRLNDGGSYNGISMGACPVEVELVAPN